MTLNLGDMATGVYWNKAALRVCHCGDALPSHDFPLLAQLYLQGQLDLDAMVTRTYRARGTWRRRSTRWRRAT